MQHKINIINNFLSQEEIDSIIKIIKASDVRDFEDNPLAKVVVNTPETLSLLKKYSDKILDAHKKTYNINVSLYTTKGYFTVWNVGALAGRHIDNHSNAEFTQLTTVIYLNDGYEGGEIYFPEFDFLYKPKAGDALIFPSYTKEHKYIHEVKQIKSGTRYTIPFWHTSLIEYADKTLL